VDAVGGQVTHVLTLEKRVYAGWPPASDAAPADAPLQPRLSCGKQRLRRPRIFDCDTHLGIDPDGSRQAAVESRERAA
jgi:hypothetical protein